MRAYACDNPVAGAQLNSTLEQLAMCSNHAKLQYVFFCLKPKGPSPANKRILRETLDPAKTASDIGQLF